MAKKNFTKSVGGLVESATSTNVRVAGTEKLLEGIPIAGDDYLNELLASTSDRTVEPAPLELPTETPAGAPTPEPGPDDFGEELPVDPRVIRETNEGLRAGRKLEEVEALVRIQPGAGEVGAAMGDPMGPFPGDGLHEFNQTPAEPFTPLDAELNRIAAEELVEWYDVLQSVLSVWGYEHFTSPKTATDAVERLWPKIANNSASGPERALYEQAQAAVLGFTKRKTSFAESVAMSAGLKQRTVRLLDRILETRQVRISPELLLGFLLLTPIIVNGGRILLEKLGFANADNVLEKFTTFVNKQETQYWREQT